MSWSGDAGGGARGAPKGPLAMLWFHLTVSGPHLPPHVVTPEREGCVDGQRDTSPIVSLVRRPC